MLPFSVEQFFALFERYNLAIWPAQLVAYVLAGFLVWSIAARRMMSWRVAAFTLGAFWLWNGLVYHLAFFTAINPAAYGFAALFVVQGVALISSGLQAGNTRIIVERDAWTAVAAGLILYAMVAYIIIGILVGHGWPRAPMFGVAPCPTTIFTLGVLILAKAHCVAVARRHPGCVGADRVDRCRPSRCAGGPWTPRRGIGGSCLPLACLPSA